MKKLYTLIVAILVTATAFAQAPEKMSYQAVVRDSGDNLVVNQMVGMQISILQGSTSGSTVYVETHTPTTNANGLVTLEIGTGTGVSGDFTTITWESDTYFIKTETDPTGGTSYTITGTSQLLSVPYALHAKTVGTESQTLANVVALGNSANGQLKNVTDPTDAQDAATKAYVDPLIAALDARITALEPLTIGDFRDGGVVFWLDGSGGGLVCAVSDQSTGIQWYNGSNSTTGATATAIGTGQANTTTIVANQGAGSYAAQLCDDLVENGYTDWFLPSRDELNQMYVNKAAIDATATGNGGATFTTSYWSSTEYDYDIAWFQYFGNGLQSLSNKDTTYYVRAVRAF